VQPPSSPSAPDEPLYEAFFGLKEQPFALTTDPRFLFMSSAHQRAYQELLTGLRRREGLLLLTADTGMGKTTLCRAVIDALGPRTFSALILNPYMSDAEVVRVILRDFGLVSRDDIRKGAFGKADMPQLLDTLEQFLRSLLPLNSYAILVIDEAQSLPPRVIDQVRQLLAYEQDGQRLLQVILAGQPGLVTTLRSDAMRAVDGRISRRTVLSALSPEEVATYIQHRLSVAGNHDGVRFPAESVKAIADLTGGVPRRINLLCDRALEEGRIAGVTEIGPDLVHQAARSLAGTTTAPLDPPIEPGDLPLADRSAAAGEPAAASSLDLSLAFGYEADDRSWLRRHWVALVGGIAVVGALGYFTWSTSTTAVASIPALPAPPPRPAVRVPDPRPMPTDDDVRYVMQEIERTYGK